jgi:hypothetical protein
MKRLKAYTPRGLFISGNLNANDVEILEKNIKLAVTHNASTGAI